MEPSRPVALVTGAAVRVGRAIAVELAQAGYDIALHFHRSAEAAEAAAHHIHSRGRRCTLHAFDLAEPESPQRLIKETAEQHGRLDVLVNNAAVFEAAGGDSIESFDPAVWEHLLRINLIAPAALCHHATPHLRASRSGSIVNLCDVAAEHPWANHLAYCASKAGLVSLTRSLARALAPQVRVNAVAPGIAAFPEHYAAETRARLIARVPMKRSGTPEDVAGVVRFLVVEGAYVTGQVWSVDGGRSLA